MPPASTTDILSCAFLFARARRPSDLASEWPVCCLPDRLSALARSLTGQSRSDSMVRGQGGLDIGFRVARMAFEGLADSYAKAQDAVLMGIHVSDQDVEKAIDTDVDEQLKRIGEGLSGSELDAERSRLYADPQNS